ncbi:hypothetical protein F4780DRAFT_20289 [Xylariomycetidae sp. FL0641]|nr:hypothetical protein F4780DRAFT_20289 [Xylariomycetidae sp. FL0641]
MAAMSDPAAHLDSDDDDKVVQIVTWFLFIVATFSVCARLITKYVTTRRLGNDDWFVVAAQITLLGQCIAVSVAASNGLGKGYKNLSDGSLDVGLKAEYASVPLLILALSLIKWSLSFFIESLTPDSLHHRLNITLRISVGIWALTAIFVGLFQCKLPSPWHYLDNTSCIDRRAWWTYVAAFNMGTEVFTVVLYFLIFSNLRTASMRKAKVLSIFSTRILVVAAAAAQLYVFRDESDHSTANSGFRLSTILNQVVLTLSVATACVPYLRWFMESLESDMGRVENSPLPGEIGYRQDQSPSHSYGLSNLSRRKLNSSSSYPHDTRLGYDSSDAASHPPASRIPSQEGL